METITPSFLAKRRVVLRDEVALLRARCGGGDRQGHCLFFQAAVEIEYGAVGAIADGVDRKLESGLVGLAHRFVEMLDVEQIGAGEACFFAGIVRERLIHPGSFSKPRAPSAKAFRLPMRR